MRRLVAIGAVVTLALAACDGTEGDEAVPPAATATENISPGSPTPGTTPSPTASPGRSPSPEPPPEPDVQLPPDAPTIFEADAAPADLPFDRLVPPGAEVDATWILDSPEDPTQQLGIVWSRGEDPLFRERGFALWMPFDDPARWQIVFAFTDPVNEGVLAIRTVEGDLTGDLVPDLLTFEDLGGSGACGTWRVITSASTTASQVFHRRTCDAELSIVGNHLELFEAVFEPGDAHCCPSAFRTTTLEWNGERFVRTNVVESPAPSP